MKKIIIAIIGGTVLILGIVMIVLPGPALIVIPAALAILATEFIWAKRALRKVKFWAAKARNRVWPATSGAPPGASRNAAPQGK